MVMGGATTRLTTVLMVPETLARLECLATSSTLVRTLVRMDSLVSPNSSRVYQQQVVS